MAYWQKSVWNLLLLKIQCNDWWCPLHYCYKTSADFRYCSSWSSQSDISVGSPIQACPPFWGAGFEQERLRDLRTPEHNDQADQQDQLPWITPEIKELNEGKKIRTISQSMWYYSTNTDSLTSYTRTVFTLLKAKHCMPLLQHTQATQTSDLRGLHQDSLS